MVGYIYYYQYSSCLGGKFYMSSIKTGVNIKFENLLSIRKKIDQRDVDKEIMKIKSFFIESGINKNGPLISATFGIENVNDCPIIDIQILVPMDKKTELPDEYTFKDVFYLENAVFSKHTGNPAMIQHTYDQMLEFIRNNRLQQITAAYNVQTKEISNSIDDFSVDIYIGVSANIL